MKSKLGRIVRRTLWVLLAVIVVLVVVAMVKGEALVRTIVEQAGSKALGVPVELADVSIRPIRGLIGIRGLKVGNPEGFKSPYLFDLGEVRVNILPRSIFTDTIVIQTILVAKPEVTYEIGMGKTNVGKLLEHLESGKKPEDEKPDEPKPEESTGGPQVIIEHFLVEGGEVHIAASMLGGKGATVALKNIEIKDIGKEGSGVSASDVVVIVMGTVLKSIIGAVGDLGGAAMDGTQAAGELGVDAAKAVGHGASSLIKGIGGLVPGGDKTNDASK